MMTQGVSIEEFGLMRRYVEEQCGITLGDDKAYLIETRLTKLISAMMPLRGQGWSHWAYYGISPGWYRWPA